MSHASGAIRTNDGKIFHCEYNGTADVMQPQLYETYDEMRANWRNYAWCECSNEGHIHTKCIIASTYGGGFYWNGYVCLDCKIIVSNLEPDDTINELPEWYPKYGVDK